MQGAALPPNAAPSTSRKVRIAEFIERWRGRGDEKQETQLFWLDLEQSVLGIPQSKAIEGTKFEYRTAGGGYIDVLCPDARFLVEQKSAGIDLDKPEQRQGTDVTPVQQALRYSDYLPVSQKPTVICTCNFQRFRFYDLEKDPRAEGAPVADFALEDLDGNYATLASIFNEDNSRIVVEQHLSENAGEKVAMLHNAIAKQYKDPDSPENHHALAVLTVRLVFCLYAEDADLFPRGSFSRYVDSYDADHLRRAIVDLFRTLNTPESERDTYLEPELKQFPYVNGGLFAEQIEIPPFTDAIKDRLQKAGDFDWRGISPVIFGSLMEETLSHDQRRQGGMHYTTEKNILRVIDPLFLDGLKAELTAIQHETFAPKTHKQHLQAFQKKLGSLQFLDPACGSGNFLTETYLCLRRLENEVLAELNKDQGMLDLGDNLNPIEVSISQFHGIEINDFAVCVARTALWIAEQQALDETASIVGDQPRLPLHNYHNIVCANALRYDWNELLPGSECNYVMGNPPFVGQYLMTDDQKSDMQELMGRDYNGYLDYATGWHYKAAHYLNDTPGAAFALVSTNSICQGQPVPALFKPLFSMGWRIKFAHRTFKWNAQSTDMANVHVIVLGMTKDKTVKPWLYSYADIQGDPVRSDATNINGYLIGGPDIFVEKRMRPISSELESAVFGSKPADGGNLFLSDEERSEALTDPIAAKFIRPFVGASELINGKDRWCLWLTDAAPSDLRSSKFLRTRIEQVRNMREASGKKATREAAHTSWLFAEIRQPQLPYLGVPRHFSGNREYMTCRRYDADTILGDACFLIPDENGLAFSIIESTMFMTWQDAIGGRIKSDCRFSNTIVWNNLPLPQLTDDMRQKVIDAGKQVIAARANHPGQSLADLYDPDFMPQDLRKAHEDLDKVVDVAFGAPKWLRGDNDSRLAILFDDYARLTSAESTAKAAKTAKTKKRARKTTTEQKA
ncbi:MAG: class I SAM-dependent DNA methyltransferase [Bifidobacteriaceae bacterium]|nr:class I SAM-dependent DNA methyltransferase [Bifidobacteriaceae bacterium]